MERIYIFELVFVYHKSQKSTEKGTENHLFIVMRHKLICCPLILLSGVPIFQNTNRDALQAHISHFKGMDILIR